MLGSESGTGEIYPNNEFYTVTGNSGNGAGDGAGVKALYKISHPNYLPVISGVIHGGFSGWLMLLQKKNGREVDIYAPWY